MTVTLETNKNLIKYHYGTRRQTKVMDQRMERLEQLQREMQDQIHERLEKIQQDMLESQNTVMNQLK